MAGFWTVIPTLVWAAAILSTIQGSSSYYSCSAFAPSSSSSISQLQSSRPLGSTTAATLKQHLPLAFSHSPARNQPTLPVISRLKSSSAAATTTSSRLHMAMVDPYTFVVAASAAISGGLFSGGLHAIAGT
jgi:hypothetical protein